MNIRDCDQARAEVQDGIIIKTVDINFIIQNPISMIITTNKVPRADTMAAPRADTMAAPGADIMEAPRADTMAAPKADTMAAPRADTMAINSILHVIMI